MSSSWIRAASSDIVDMFENVDSLPRALEGRDLFDINCALKKRHLNIEKVLESCRHYMEFVVERAPFYKEFMQNMNEKMNDSEFLTDVEPLLRPEVHFAPAKVYQLVYDNLIYKLPSKRD